MILVRRKIVDCVGYRIMGVWPIQSAKGLIEEIDDITCDPTHGVQFTIISSGGLWLDNDKDDKLIIPVDSSVEADPLNLVVHSISDEIGEKLYFNSHEHADYFWLIHAADKELNAFDMSMPGAFLEPVSKVIE